MGKNFITIHNYVLGKKSDISFWDTKLSAWDLILASLDSSTTFLDPTLAPSGDVTNGFKKGVIDGLFPLTCILNSFLLEATLRTVDEFVGKKFVMSFWDPGTSTAETIFWLMNSDGATAGFKKDVDLFWDKTSGDATPDFVNEATADFKKDVELFWGNPSGDATPEFLKEATSGFLKEVTDGIPDEVFVDTFLGFLEEVPNTDLDLLRAD